MKKCSDDNNKNTNCCGRTEPSCSAQQDKTVVPADTPLAWFGEMIQHCYDHAAGAKDKGERIVGIMCEYTPRELIMAADALYQLSPASMLFNHKFWESSEYI